MTVLRLTTADGVDLAAEFAPAGGSQLAAAVLLHPHPLMGGDMHAPVPDHLFRTLPGEGIAVLRFDFRGAGGSRGEHGGGGPEVADVGAAVTELAARAAAPVWLVGWSFGADVSLRFTGEDVAGWVAVAPPLQQPGIDAAGTDPRPVRLLVPEHDQFRSPAEARRRCGEWTATEVGVVEGGDHFLAGRLGEVAGRVAGMLSAGR